MSKSNSPGLPGREDVIVSFDTSDLAALDAWIADQDIPFTRDEAIRAIVSATLQLMTPEQ